MRYICFLNRPKFGPLCTPTIPAYRPVLIIPMTEVTSFQRRDLCAMTSASSPSRPFPNTDTRLPSRTVLMLAHENAWTRYQPISLPSYHPVAPRQGALTFRHNGRSLIQPADSYRVENQHISPRLMAPQRALQPLISEQLYRHFTVSLAWAPLQRLRLQMAADRPASAWFFQSQIECFRHDL